MYTGFSATIVNPQATGPQALPRFSVCPSTIFNARRKNTGGFSRASCAFTYISPGQFVVLTGAATTGAGHTEFAWRTFVAPLAAILVPVHSGVTVQLFATEASG